MKQIVQRDMAHTYSFGLLTAMFVSELQSRLRLPIVFRYMCFSLPCTTRQEVAGLFVKMMAVGRCQFVTSLEHFGSADASVAPLIVASGVQ